MEIGQRRGRQGPSLVEIIVGFLLLAVVIAVLVTVMTGRIDEANRQAARAEAVSVTIAAQAAAELQYQSFGGASAGEYVWSRGVTSTDASGEPTAFFGEIRNAVGMSAQEFSVLEISITLNARGDVMRVLYKHYGHTVVYQGGIWSVL
jgi:type II secretory pathway pseudopilin PulG